MHWTYEKPEEISELQQGDILEPSEALLNLFNEVHPYFTQPKYRGFLILTQTCDLLRRERAGQKSCSATHVCLSVIRSVQDIISQSLSSRFGYLAPGIYASHSKKAVENLVERLVNQNENALGLFYLHRDIDSGISVHSVALLRVAISVKAADHFNTLLKARVGRLSKEFQPKLGWMVGNLYSRVGVTDWKEKSEIEKQNIEEDIIKEILSFTRSEPIWLDRSLYSKILKKTPDFNTLPESSQEEIIRSSLPPPPKEKAIEIIAQIVKTVVPKIKDEDIEKIKSRLANNDQFEAQMRKFGANSSIHDSADHVL